jgi:hypothetical protein
MKANLIEKLGLLLENLLQRSGEPSRSLATVFETVELFSATVV